jgi:type IV pilus assembly protein PilM
MIQLKPTGKTMRVMGYGYADFPRDAIVEGIVVDPEEIAEALRPLLKQMSYGHITASRVATSLPVGKIFTRVLELPPMGATDMDAAVRLAAEQYVPVPLPDLYIDYEVILEEKEHIQVLMVAAPRAIVDSYVKLFDLMNLEVGFIESSLSAVTRALTAAAKIDQVTLVADIGSASIDLAVHDHVLRLTDTIVLGGDNLTGRLMTELGVSRDQANEIKMKFGIAKSGLQPKINSALKLPLNTICMEMKRVMKYYADRSENKRPVQTVLLAGGSASMPGLVEYLTQELGVPVGIADPWSHLECKHIQAISKHDAPMYTTAIGLARMEGRL